MKLEEIEYLKNSLNHAEKLKHAILTYQRILKYEDLISDVTRVDLFGIKIGQQLRIDDKIVPISYDEFNLFKIGVLKVVKELLKNKEEELEDLTLNLS